MRANKKNDIKRMEDMIKNERLNLSDDFYKLLNNDIKRVLMEYFDIKENPEIKITKTPTGCFVNFSVSAVNIKSFSTIPSENEV